ncbi:MAG: hypothetical protein CMJ18_15395 [Phycisphaeraceae bacterium]|nr:hypothetical protein [Phycisphaeraceae bacterium]
MTTTPANSHRLTSILIVSLLAAAGCGTAAARDGAATPFDSFTRAWREDPIWNDGKAEIAHYDAIRSIYGVDRNFTARVFVNKEHASAQTKTKSASGQGRGVFKVHWRHDIPTENYRYHYSTMCYVGTRDLKSLKLDMGSQEDCGASFKQFINHAGTLEWHQFSYFPDEGHRQGTYSPPANLVFHDALGLILRGYPFDAPRTIELKVLRSQTSTRLGTYEPVSAKLSYRGKIEIDLPVGTRAAHHLVLEFSDDATDQYWFAADATAPMLHLLLQYEGSDGIRMRLARHERRAYWKR